MSFLSCFFCTPRHSKNKVAPTTTPTAPQNTTPVHIATTPQILAVGPTLLPQAPIATRRLPRIPTAPALLQFLKEHQKVTRRVDAHLSETAQTMRDIDQCVRTNQRFLDELGIDTPPSTPRT